MRTEREMLDMILSTARADDRIRAVVMNGSRANPNAPRDFFQDYDIVYFVMDVEPYKHNHEWLKRFGELMIVQMPEDMEDPPPNRNGGFVYLMQFTDGNRIDLGIDPLAMIHEIVADSQSIVLLDKDGCIPALPPASDRDYLPKPPTAKAFWDCCNEFWWVSPYVAKGLWRRELPYARQMFEEHVRSELMRMLIWHVGVTTGFSRNVGKFGKYLEQLLEPEVWAMLQKTYSDTDYERTWDALFAACDLFRLTATRVASRFGFAYPAGDDARVSAHLRHVRKLPRDAKEMY